MEARCPPSAAAVVLVSKKSGCERASFPGREALGYNTPVPKWIKTIIAVLLLPFCAGAVKALVRLLAATGRAETIWVATIGGAACWLIIFLLLPKPMRLYIFGHELTHAIWAWIFGGKVKKFKVTANGGHVVITKSNFVIALAPYFVPLYVAPVVLGFILGA